MWIHVKKMIEGKGEYTCKRMIEGKGEDSCKRMIEGKGEDTCKRMEGKVQGIGRGRWNE